jgi:hypothetical protein
MIEHFAFEIICDAFGDLVSKSQGKGMDRLILEATHELNF